MAGSPMRKVSLRNLAAHKVRLALTLLSVVLGTAFVTGSFVFTDSLQKTFDGIFANVAQGVDVRVSPEDVRSPGVSLSDVDTITKIDGVRAVAPAEFGTIVLLTKAGKAVQNGGAPSIGQSYLPPDKALEKLDPYVSGGPPTKPGEISLNQGAATRADLQVGDKTKILSARGQLEVTITGIYQPASDTGGFIGAYFDESQARELFTDGSHVAYIDIAGNGVSANELRDRIQKEFPDLKVQNGDEVREDAKAQISQALSFINYFLLAFGAIALLVGTFIIYNTFSMIVAQRLRELALLRAVGASRRQVGFSVVLEALIVGLIGSALGLAAGVGLALGLTGLLNAFDLGIPTGSMQLAARTVVVALVVGVVVTTLSAYAPARRAAKIPPVEAMREEFASAGDSLRMRTIIGALLAVAGVVAVVIGAQFTGAEGASTVGGGALALVLAVLLAAPSLSRPIVNALGAVVTRPFGPIGRLARSNAVRNPRRTAATAFALTLGLMLVSLIATFGASAKASVDTLVDKGVKADYMLTGPQGFGVVVPAEDAARKVDGVDLAVGLRFVPAQVGDENAGNGVSFSGPVDPVLTMDLVSGERELADDGMLVSETQSDKKGWKLGDTVELTNYADEKSAVHVKLKVTGIFEDSQVLGDWIVSDTTYQAMTPSDRRADFLVLIKAKSGADMTSLRTGLEKATDPYVVVQVLDREQFKGEQGKQIDTLLAVLYGLLALAIVIAILGIINTLALSVVERRREIGMLRAVGMARNQVRRTIYLESVLIAVFGAIVGVILGLGLGAGFIRTLRDQGLGEIAIPWAQVIAMLIGSAVVGVLAALWPAARAARTKPLEAIADL